MTSPCRGPGRPAARCVADARQRRRTLAAPSRQPRMRRESRCGRCQEPPAPQLRILRVRRCGPTPRCDHSRQRRSSCCAAWAVARSLPISTIRDAPRTRRPTALAMVRRLQCVAPFGRDSNVLRIVAANAHNAPDQKATQTEVERFNRPGRNHIRPEGSAPARMQDTTGAYSSLAQSTLSTEDRFL